VPLTEGHGISIGMTTVGGQACFGVYAQAELADDAELIARGIDHAIDELLARCDEPGDDSAPPPGRAKASSAPPRAARSRTRG